MKQTDNSLIHSKSDEVKNKTKEVTAFEKDLIDKLSKMREEIQPLIYNRARPERNEYVQRANFLYALIFKIKEEYQPGTNLLDFVKSLEKGYPLAAKTVSEVKNMLEMQRNNR